MLIFLGKEEIGGNTQGCHFLLQGGLPNPGVEPRSSVLQADAFPSESPGRLTQREVLLYPTSFSGENTSPV